MAKKLGMIVSLASAMWTVGVAAQAFVDALQIDDLDTDGNGAVTAEEFQAHALARWAASDENHDGKVTEEEIRRKRLLIKQERFVVLDRDGSGELERSEMGDLSAEVFSRLDLDASGTLSQAELEGGLMVRSIGGRVSPGGLPGDTNGDGAVTKQEAIAAATLMMRYMDENSDGKLTPDELRRPVGFQRGVYPRFE